MSQLLVAGQGKALDLAREGEIAARGIQAQHGNALYYQEQSICKPDGGAVVGMLSMEGLAKVWG